MLGYLNGISFMGYDFQSYPNSQKISLSILTYPNISYHIPTYPKISSGANSQMSVCRGESSAKPLEPVGSMLPCNVQPRLQSLMMEWNGSNTRVKVGGLGGAPWGIPLLSTHIALRPNWFDMTKKEPVYIRRNRATSSAGNPLASRIWKIARWFTALNAFLMSRYRTTDRLCLRLRCSASMLRSLPSWRLVFRFLRKPSCVSSRSP
jgi:hypothetical protein